jgi:hypothetical protein
MRQIGTHSFGKNAMSCGGLPTDKTMPFLATPFERVISRTGIEIGDGMQSEAREKLTDHAR